MKIYDYIVIGAGSSLITLSALEQKKFKIALIEEGPLGGTCLNRGCIPSKMLIAAADFYQNLSKGKKFHIGLGEKKIDFDSIIKDVKKIIMKEEKELSSYYEKSPYVDLYRSHGKFISPYAIEVDGKIIKGRNIILNVGGRPRIPPIEGLKDTPYITSDDILKLKTKPKKMVVIGTGYIGVEYGFFFGALQTDVHLIGNRKVLESEDGDIVDEFKKGIGKYCSFHENCEIKKVTYKKGNFSIDFIENRLRKKISCDTLLVTTGREPNTQDLGLENTYIELLKNQLIKVNDYLETTQKKVWAFGDCIEGFFFKHSANFEAQYLKEYFFSRKKRKIAYPEIPYAIFSYPEIACVGRKEKDLNRESYFIGKARYTESARGVSLKEELGFAKLVFDKKSKKLIGAQIVGAEASNMIHTLIALMSKKSKLEDLMNFIYIHPALPEIIKKSVEDAFLKIS